MLARVNGSLMIDGKPEGLLALEKVTVPLWSAGGDGYLTEQWITSPTGRRWRIALAAVG